MPLSSSPLGFQPGNTRAPELLAAIFTGYPFVFAVIIARLLVRYRHKSLGSDDYSMLVAGILLVATTPLTILFVHHGGGRHSVYLDSTDLTLASRDVLIVQVIVTFAELFARIAIGIQLLRIFGPMGSKRKHVIRFSLLFQAALTVVFLFATFGCIPPRAVYEVIPEASCLSAAVRFNIGFAQSITGVLMDFLLALIPATFVRNLQMSRNDKICLSILLGLGVGPGIIATARTFIMGKTQSFEDLTWDVFDLYVWAFIELYLVVILGSAPSLRPLFKRTRKAENVAPIRPVSSPLRALAGSGSMHSKFWPNFTSKETRTYIDLDKTRLEISSGDDLKVAGTFQNQDDGRV